VQPYEPPSGFPGGGSFRLEIPSTLHRAEKIGVLGRKDAQKPLAPAGIPAKKCSLGESLLQKMAVLATIHTEINLEEIMRILISNDDGIAAPGIRALAKRLSKDHEVTVVAPSREQSGVGHSITYFTPIFSRPASISGVDAKAIAVDGSPVDCVKFGIRCVFDEKPDLVVTGINQGPNIGPDVFPSGTVNAAIAGVMEGVPAIAVSYADFIRTDFEASAELAARLVNFVQRHPIPKGMLLNLNVPALPFEEIKGVCVVPLEAKGLEFCYETRESPMKRSYHWMTIVGVREKKDKKAPASDADAIIKGYASITPIKIDMSDYDYIEKLKETGEFI